jgi:hypothetical protein
MKSKLYNHRIHSVFVLILLALCAGVRVDAHTFHTSLTRIEFNAEEQSVEVTIQLFTHDLEEALSRRGGRRVMLDRTPDADKLTLSYIQDYLKLKDKKGNLMSFSWVGMEPEADAVLVYVEAKMPEGIRGGHLKNQLLFDLVEDQVNITNLRNGEARTDAVFRPGDDFKEIE